jgi:hypothetical protein
MDNRPNKPMTASERRAVQAALEAQGNIIHPGKELNVARFQEPAQPRVKFSYVQNGKPMSYQAVWAQKNRAGFKSLSVKSYCDMLALLEMDEK